MSISTFLHQRNVKFSFHRYGIEAVNAMALGLFSSLIIGLIIKTIGSCIDTPWLVQLGEYAQQFMGAAIGIAVSRALQAPPLVLFASTITGSFGALWGGPVGCFVAVCIGSEVGKIVHQSTHIDIIATPASTIISGALVARFIGPWIQKGTTYVGELIMWSVDLQPLWMGMVVSIVMGMLLTLPVSSAAIAISLSLSGLAAGAATAGCCAQMIGFAIMSFKDNRWNGLLSVGLGTSMLQMPNIIKNPKIWIPPIIASAIGGAIATTVFKMSNIPAGAGMGTSGFVGQIATIDSMGNTPTVWSAIMILHIVLPAVICGLMAKWFRIKRWIKEGDLLIATKK